MAVQTQATLNERVTGAEKQVAELKQTLTAKDADAEALNRELSEYKSNIAELETRLEEERKAAVEKLALLDCLMLAAAEGRKSKPQNRH